MLPRITTLAALLAAGCGEAPAPASDPAYPRDDVLALQHVQAVGTHNSYHVETPGLGLEHLAFSHAPLDVQLGEQGVRQFELDLWWLEDELRVVHDPLFDLGTSCRTFTECLGVIGAWSADHPGHHPLLVLVELKTPFWEPSAAAILDAVDAGVRAVWPDDGVITPAEVQGEHGSLREAMAERGWPPLAELRGRTLLVLLSGGDWLTAHLARGTPLLFPNARGDLTAPHAAVHTIDDPIGRRLEIEAAAHANHLVRTRADSGGDEARAGDTRRLQAALEGGGHFITTDYPVPQPPWDYQVRIPGGTPSGCNPVSAPADCTPGDIESPEHLR